MAFYIKRLMKRNLYIVLLIAMLLPGKGMAVFQHFCGGELISFELFLKHYEPCCDDHSNPCDGCEDQEAIFSLDDFRTPHSDILVIDFLHAAMAQPSFHLPSTQFFESRNYTTPKKAPPGWSGRYRSILFQSFLL